MNTDMPENQRKIIHVDMDCFYAAVEMRDDPSLRDRPIAVGGAADRRGVISTCNYPARDYGVHSAMPTAQALRLCPSLLVISGRMSYYHEVSQQIRQILDRYTEIIEPLSLDEAYLDVTGTPLFRGSATLIAEDIRRTIELELSLTASAGVAPNKFLAKIASDENKPDGLCVVTPDGVAEFVRELPLSRIPGVGRVTGEKLAESGLRTCADVRAKGRDAMLIEWGQFGEHLYRRSQGIDTRPLTTHWIRKSLSVEHTYPNDIDALPEADEALTSLIEELRQRLSKHTDRRIRNQQVKLKFTDFRTTTIERSTAEFNPDLFRELVPLAWDRGDGKGIRLLGIGVSFHEERDGDTRQMALF